jgi:hypothetical protein
MNSWARNAQTWKMMARSSSILFFAGVFGLFASPVLIGSGINFQSQSRLEMIGAALIGGGSAIAWAYAGTRRIFWLFVVVGLLQFAAFNILAVLSGPHPTLGAQELEQKLRRNGHVEIVLIVVACV